MLSETRWWRPLKADPSHWLLDYDNPAVRYWMLTDVLNRAADTPAVREARAALGASPLVTRLFELQAADGGWASPAQPDVPTWQSTANHLVALAELGVPGHDERVATAADWALQGAQSPDGDFDLPGAFLWALLRFGYDDDGRVRRAVRRAAKSIVARGSPDTPIVRDAWDSLPALWALTALPARERSRAIEVAIATAAADVEHGGWSDLAPGARQLGFPHLGAPDLLFALRVLAAAGRASEERVAPGVALLAQQQDDQGRWPLTRNHADRLLVPLEGTGPHSKWSTLNALRVLRATEHD